MTPEVCIVDCGGDGFSYAGVEFGGVRFPFLVRCDHLIANKNLTTDQSQCNMACVGNASETCGAGNRIDIWHDPTVPDPTITTQIGPWKYLGCFADSTSKRILDNPVSVGGILTPQKCFDACKAQGYGVAGLEFASECWCDKFLYLPGDPVPTEEETQFCSMTCNGDSTQFCGGSAYVEIYLDTSVTSVDGCLDLTPRWDFTVKVGLRGSASDANMSATVIRQTDGFGEYLLAVRFRSESRTMSC
ncbi:WSC-domain-containing protein [Macrolepiota fuliginosa MF-IS2]|uniref:WSC-domain-containing protein n=1 Tax=Macrolepiota fuliginosa MF-IS2 TaxID=1400762 RepID=A0A9P6BZN3_9AGAR|nr:WSC-domain-containing protein [Macrolepiota fuliginosa MF-IS2]